MIYTKLRGAIAACLLLLSVTSSAQQLPAFRPPAVPLIAHDPYFSVWSNSDDLAGDRTRHWTGAPQGMAGIMRVDGKPYRFMGQWYGQMPPQMKQISVEVFPTRTIYEFEASGVHLTLTFMSPLLPEDLDVLARPVTYINADVHSVDGQAHRTELYFDATAEFAVNNTSERVIWSRPKINNLHVRATGTQLQPVLEQSGDDLRIDWGYLYLASEPTEFEHDAIGWNQAVRRGFAESGELPDTDDLNMPRPAKDQLPVMAFTSDLGPISRTAVSRHIMIAYDDLYSVEFFNRRLKPYWRRDGWGAAELLTAAAHDYDSLKRRCESFDAELMKDLRAAGGEQYARIAALAFRQTIAAHKLVADWDGNPLFLSKENFSNGSIGTVDVTYPSSPFFLLFNPKLLEAQLRPIFQYAALPRWKFPFAPHDLGTYPLANGQTYGGGERSEVDQMPVEECGNMLLTTAALARAEGNAAFAQEYWGLLTRWAEYLRDKGMDPENQLSTDDFAGHLAHNANLSAKAILALAAYGYLCETLGKTSESANYRKLAATMADQWVKSASDGDHYKLAFDKPGTWSQKYNLVWDKLLDLRVFPTEVARRELNYYATRQKRYGLPLDSRETYTKLDWIVWTATLAASEREFQSFIQPVYRFINESPNRVPLSDWYDTVDAKQKGFQARSVVGGIYIKMLTHGGLWLKWSSRASNRKLD